MPSPNAPSSTPQLVEDVIWGCVTQAGEQAVNVARSTVLAAGWPEGVPATTVDRQCGSSQQAVHFAAAGLVAGHYDLVVAGGVESMTREPLGSAMTEGTFGDAVLTRYADALAAQGAATFHQGLGAEDIATRWGLSRTQLDEFAVGSHERAAAAADSGAFDEQLAPVTRPDGTTVTADEGIRRGTSVEALAGLRTAFRPDGTVTAGNASQISDGAAALLMTTSERAAELGTDAAGPRAQRRRRGRRPGDHADRADPRDREGPGPVRAHAGRHRRLRGQRGVRQRGRSPGWPRPVPTRSGSTPRAGRSRWGIRWAPRGRAS